jgi:DNA transformation protein
MPRRSEFVEYLLEMLQPLGEVRAKAMFGGWGFYAGERFFALVAEDTFYVKADAASRAEFEARGLQPFRYEASGKVSVMAYYQPPPEALDDRALLCAWARKGIEAAERAAQAKKVRRAGQVSAKKRASS